MSQRQLIVNAVEALLKTIRTINGYTTDSGMYVHQGLTHPLESGTLPAYAWEDGEGYVSYEGEIGMADHTVTFTVESCAKGDDCREVALVLLKDVVTAIGLDYTLGGLANRTEITGHAIRSSQNENKIASGTLTFSVIYTTSPFSL